MGRHALAVAGSDLEAVDEQDQRTKERLILLVDSFLNSAAVQGDPALRLMAHGPLVKLLRSKIQQLGAMECEGIRTLARSLAE